MMLHMLELEDLEPLELEYSALKFEELTPFEFGELASLELPVYDFFSLAREVDDQEVNFEELKASHRVNKLAYLKIQFCGKEALKNDQRYFWIDTCCIDQPDIAELTESIKSMFKCHQYTKVYIYLSEVNLGELKTSSADDSWTHKFRQSQCFTRALTLEELIAPCDLHNFGRQCKMLGTRSYLVNSISHTTGVPIRVLQDANDLLVGYSGMQRMSWVARRKTIRTEDRRCTLLQFFDAAIPILYGEGTAAFHHLQPEILGKANNHSIFAWTDPEIRDPRGGITFADDPRAFTRAEDIPWASGSSGKTEIPSEAAVKAATVAALKTLVNGREEDIQSAPYAVATLPCRCQIHKAPASKITVYELEACIRTNNGIYNEACQAKIDAHVIEDCNKGATFKIAKIFSSIALSDGENEPKALEVYLEESRVTKLHAKHISENWENQRALAVHRLELDTKQTGQTPPSQEHLKSGSSNIHELNTRTLETKDGEMDGSDNDTDGTESDASSIASSSSSDEVDESLLDVLVDILVELITERAFIPASLLGSTKGSDFLNHQEHSVSKNESVGIGRGHKRKAEDFENNSSKKIHLAEPSKILNSDDTDEMYREG